METSSHDESFDQAVQDVNRSEDGGIVEIFVPKREYPLPPEGLHKAVCIKAEIADSRYPDAKPGAKILKLRWQLDQTYEDDNGDTRHYIVFSKTYSCSFHPESGLSQLCVSLTGRMPLYEGTNETRDGKVGERQRFRYRCFIDMECRLLVKHIIAKKNGKKYASASEYLTDDDQKRNNVRLLMDAEIPGDLPFEV